MIKRTLSLLLIIVSLTPVIYIFGCSGLSKKYPVVSYYVLDVTRKNGGSDQILDGLLLVRRFKLSPVYEGNEFVYRTDEFSYTTDFYNKFLKSPNAIITLETTQWLSDSGLFQYVLNAGSVQEPHYILEGNIKSLYADYRNGNSPKAILEIQFFLLDVESTDKIIFSNNYRKEIALQNRNPQDLMGGWNEALTQILIDFERDLKVNDFAPKR